MIRRVIDRIAYGDVGVAGVALGVDGGEDREDEDEGADDLGREACAVAVFGGHQVGASAVYTVQMRLQTLHDRGSTHGSQALGCHVQQGTRQGHLPRQEQAERDRRIDVATFRSTEFAKKQKKTTTEVS